MNKILDFIIDIFLIILMFAAVTVYFGLRMEPEIKTLVKIATSDIVEDAKKNGYITLNDYDKFMEKLSLTDTLYNISFEHSYNVWEPEYRKRTLQEILDAQNSSYTGSNVYTYREVVSELPQVNDPVNNGNLNTDTNESVLAKAVNKPASSSHVHTDDCYDGTKHVHTGNSSSGGGCYGKANNTTSNCKSKSFHTTRHLQFKCENCKLSATYGEGVPIPSKCPNCSSSKFAVVRSFEYWVCDSCGNLFLIDNWPSQPSVCGATISGSTTYEPNCGKTEGKYYKNDIEVFPTCDKVVTSISPTHPVQTVAVGENIISTVVATYLDGATKTIIADITGYDRSKLGKQTVTLTYSGLVNNAKTTGKKTCTATITVVPLSKKCTNGHTYNLNSDGTDPGCPYCRAYVASLQIIYPTSTSMIITIGTTLKDNGLKLKVTYMDGHTETITDGYIDNLDKKYFGTMLVTIGYKGAKAQIRVTTICKKVVCTICGNTYSLYPDGSDPGCPYCIEKIPVFTGKILEYTEAEYTEDILKILYQDGIYQFSKNDTFNISISNKSSNLSRQILKKLIPSLSNEWMSLRDSVTINTNTK